MAAGGIALRSSVACGRQTGFFEVSNLQTRSYNLDGVVKRWDHHGQR